MWVLDSIGITTKELTLEEDKVYQEFCKNIVYQDNHYVVGLPWKTDVPALTPNYGIAKGRLRSSLNKLIENGLVETYSEILEDQLKRGFIEKVDESKYVGSKCHYIPHLPVIREHHTTPIRIVFDASAKCPGTGYSLNDMLHTGPSLVPDLASILLRFRWPKYVCISDISKAFLCLGLKEEDRNYVRFLWPTNPLEVGSKLDTYRFRRVLFGATSSPFLLQATIKYHFSQYVCKYGVLPEQLMRNLYVDNLHGGAESEQELLSFYKESVEGYLEAGLPLREWTSNSERLNERVQEDRLADTSGSSVVKMLGLLWDTKSDLVMLNKVELNSKAATKREVLSQTCRIFDPLGYFFPKTIKARLFVQKLWKKKYDWDEKLSHELLIEWEEFVSDTEELFECKVPRRAFCSKEPCSLHVFADSSTEAMGCCAYVVQNGVSSLLVSKARVAPVKELTIPKLELTAAILGSRLAKYIIKTFSHEITFTSVHLWGDSQIVLCWLVSEQEHKNLFVRNRVSEFKQNVPNMIVHHVTTNMNPADLFTRKKSISLRNNDLWWNGPSLLAEESLWIPYHPSKGANVLLAIADDFKSEPVGSNVGLPNIKRFNDLDKLLRVSSYVFRVFDKLKIVKQNARSDQYRNCSISPDEIAKSENMWLQEHQKICYPKELAYLTGKSTSKTQIINQLKLKLEDGLIKVHSRLQNSELPDTTINPILISGKHDLCKLLIMQAHERTFHGSVSTVMDFLRKRFWLPRCRQLAKPIIYQCPTCKLLKGTPYQVPEMPSLPIQRVTEAKPFQFTGVDYTGPLYVKAFTGKLTTKVYVALFTCLCTRAVHLEVSIDASAEAFARVFRRFVAQNTAPQIMYSDRGSNFIGFQPMLKEFMNSPVITPELLRLRTSWKFIPAKAPWMGGVWERLIGITKKVLKNVLGGAYVTIDELQTIVVEVCARVNSRPLTFVGSEIDEPIPLTPIQLLKGTVPDTLPPIISEEDINDETFATSPSVLSKRHKRMLHLIELAWKRWKSEYLVSLRERDRRLIPGNVNGTVQPAVGDVVVFPANVGSKELTLGRVIELLPGQDGQCRAIRLKSRGGESVRPVAKVAFLESVPPNPEQSVDKASTLAQISGEASPSLSNVRPKRQAAVEARAKIKAISSTDPE